MRAGDRRLDSISFFDCLTPLPLLTSSPSLHIWGRKGGGIARSSGEEGRLEKGRKEEMAGKDVLPSGALMTLCDDLKSHK